MGCKMEWQWQWQFDMPELVEDYICRGSLGRMRSLQRQGRQEEWQTKELGMRRWRGQGQSEWFRQRGHAL